MLKIELVPDLSHCIHTITKKEYDDTLRRLLSTENEDKTLEKKLVLLTLLLKDLDFKQLRHESEKYITEGKKVKFVFYLENNMPKYEMQVNKKYEI
jgi:hypothetical protein